MAKKKNIYGNGPDEDLQGFEEVYDLYEEEREKKRSNERYHNPHELLNFLEKEHQRLEKIDVFFSDKATNLITHPTTESLCEVQQENIERIQDDLWHDLKKPNSIFLKNLNFLFNKVFK